MSSFSSVVTSTPPTSPFDPSDTASPFSHTTATSSSTCTTPVPQAQSFDERFEQMRELARQRAQVQHAEQKARALANGIAPSLTTRKAKKSLTKRQLSSKRSAEICRIKSNIYTELLERAVADEEAACNTMCEQVAKLFSDNLAIAKRISQLEQAQSHQPTRFEEPAQSAAVQQLHQNYVTEMVEESTIPGPSLSADFQFDLSQIMDLSLPPSLSQQLPNLNIPASFAGPQAVQEHQQNELTQAQTVVQNHKKLEDDSSCELILPDFMMGDATQSSSPVTHVSSDQSSSPTRICDSIFAI